MQTPMFEARVSDSGRVLEFDVIELEARQAYLAKLAGQRVGIVIKPYKALRSLQANNYYWGQVLEVMAQDASSGDQSAEEIHDAMCAMFLPDDKKRVEFYNRMTGEQLTVETDGRRSSKLTGEPFYQFVEKVRKFALEFMGVRTENPDPLYWRRRKQKEAA